MRISLGAGIIVAILAPFVVYFLRFQSVYLTFFEIFLLLGAWIIISSSFFPQERTMYLIVGILLGVISSVFIIPITYAAALVLVGIIAAVIVASTTRK